jgi:hypothetical protein
MFLHVTTIDFRGLFLSHKTTASSTGVKASYLHWQKPGAAPPCVGSTGGGPMAIGGDVGFEPAPKIRDAAGGGVGRGSSTWLRAPRLAAS